MYQLIHTKEENKFGWMEMGIVVKIHVPIQWYQSIGLPIKMCRQGRLSQFIQAPSCDINKMIQRRIIENNWHFLEKLASAKNLLWRHANSLYYSIATVASKY
jgi:hypothetical protein